MRYINLLFLTYLVNFADLSFTWILPYQKFAFICSRSTTSALTYYWNSEHPYQSVCRTITSSYLSAFITYKAAG